jgi:thiol:disulfide interchange protein DsbA
MNRRAMLKQLSVLGLLASAGPAVLAQENLRFRKMRNRINPEEAGKIEVIVFFHYGCPHCRNFDPLFAEWTRTVPEDVSLRSNPVIWADATLRGLARLHYTADRTGTIEQLRKAIFSGVQDSKLPLHTESGVADWIKRFDIDAKKFMDAYKSFGMQALVQRADQVTKTYQVSGVPTVAVAGQYMTSPSMTGGHENTILVMDELIQRARTEGGRS